jgi:hypothetical protein
MKSPAKPTAAVLARRRRYRPKGTQTRAVASLLGKIRINDAGGFATQQNLREVLQLPLRFGRLGALTARQ